MRCLIFPLRCFNTLYFHVAVAKKPLHEPPLDLGARLSMQGTEKLGRPAFSMAQCQVVLSCWKERSWETSLSDYHWRILEMYSKIWPWNVMRSYMSWIFFMYSQASCAPSRCLQDFDAHSEVQIVAKPFYVFLFVYIFVCLSIFYIYLSIDLSIYTVSIERTPIETNLIQINLSNLILSYLIWSFLKP